VKRGDIKGEKKEIKTCAFMRPAEGTVAVIIIKEKTIKLQAEERLSIERHKLKINEGREGSRKWGRLMNLREIFGELRNIE
jgi:hypothetical protein